MKLSGVDLSDFNSVSLSKYKDYDFVIAKATEGRTWRAHTFHSHIKNAIANGQLIGCYHYARPDNNTPEQEVENFLTVVKPYIGKAILALDWEQTSLKYPASWALKFMNLVRERTGSSPFLYIQQSALVGGKYDCIARADYPLWMAQYNKSMSNNHGAFRDVAIWQYTSCDGTLDKDYFYGTKEAWMKYVNPNSEDNTIVEEPVIVVPSVTPAKVKIVGVTKKGDKNVHVKALQILLADLGYYKGAIDSDFGVNTDKAVRDFQKAEGLAVDGLVGINTWLRLVGYR